MSDPTPTPSTDRAASGLLHAATDTLVPDVDRLVRGGVSRGRALRRRRRVGASLAALAAVVAVGVAVGVGTPLLGGDAAPPEVADTQTDDVRATDRALAVTAADVPALVDEILGSEATAPVKGDPTYTKDAAREKIKHFLYDGARATVIIEPAGLTCPERVAMDAAEERLDVRSSCEEQGGLTVLTSRERVDEVVTREASAWNHGYVVRALSTNADRRTVVEAPTLSQDELLALVTSERWFGR